MAETYRRQPCTRLSAASLDRYVWEGKRGVNNGPKRPHPANSNPPRKKLPRLLIEGIRWHPSVRLKQYPPREDHQKVINWTKHGYYEATPQRTRADLYAWIVKRRLKWRSYQRLKAACLRTAAGLEVTVNTFINQKTLLKFHGGKRCGPYIPLPSAGSPQGYPDPRARVPL
jgi:hypothetical protein